MKGWKSTVKRKKIQRHINGVIRDLNKQIERDNLWLGRFYCHQKSIDWTMSDDSSWVYALICIEFVDRKTGKFSQVHFRKEDFMGSTWRVWEAMNNFIVLDCDVWRENPRPSIKNPWNYREVRK